MFMGSELGAWREWTHDESLEWHLLEHPLHAGLRRWVQDLNRTYLSERSLHQIDFDSHGFSWIDCHDSDNSVVSFIRRAKDPDDFTVMVVNFTPVPRAQYRIGVPEPGRYRELLNSDAAIYGGSNVGNAGGVSSEPVPAHGFGQSLAVEVPPLGFVLLKR
jgi:1,4-alpha-glucan branching enzyme